MSKLLDKIKDAMTRHKSRSKRASHGSDSLGYDDADGFGGRSDPGPYRHEDYGSRFGSYGNKLRPGTYGSSSQNDTSSSYSSARTRQSFDGNAAGSSGPHRPLRDQRGGSYRVQL
ncbi:hypothetical protein BDV06DRAFT_206555 [Aspergillus oleicola]